MAQIELDQILGLIGIIALALCIGVGGMYGLPLVVRWRQVRRWGAIDGKLALTYDDGPDDVTTVELLGLLDELDVQATFYLVGFRGEKFPQVLKELKASGHELATHTHLHKNAWKKPPWFEYRDAMRAYRTLEGTVGARDSYRPPFGKISLATLLGMWIKGRRVEWWTVSTNDTADVFGDPDEVAKGILDEGGVVVLMHCHHKDPDRRAYVLELTRALIEQARARGLELVTMDGLGR